MSWKKIGKHLLFPHGVVMALLLIAGAVSLSYSFLYLEETDPLRIGSYVLSFYTLTVWCLRMPEMVRSVGKFRRENPYARMWLENGRLRMNVTLAANLLWNGGYGALQLGLGFYHRSFWFCSLAVYYFSLACMRLFLVRHSVRHAPGERMREELRRYRACGWVFLITNLALTVMVVYMVVEGRAVKHGMVTTIAMATFTFASLTMAIVKVFKYWKMESPVFSASRAISLAAACVSLLTLENTMLVTFESEAMTLATRRLFLALTGGAVSAFIISMAVYMIVSSNRSLKAMEISYERE